MNCLNPWDSQTIRQYDANGLYPALTSNATGGQNRQGVVYAVEGNTVDRASNKNGKGWCEDVSPTMNTQDRHAVAFMAGQGAKARSVGAVEDGSPTLKASPSGLNQAPTVVCGVDCRNGVLDKDKIATLQAHANGGYSLNCTHPVLYDTTQITSPMNWSNPKQGDPSHPLTATGDPPLLIYPAGGVKNENI